MGLLGGSAGGGRRNMGGGFHFWNVVDIPFSHMNPIPTPVGNPVGEAVLEMYIECVTFLLKKLPRVAVSTLSCL